MDGLELFADDIDGRLCVAVTQKGVLTDLYADRADMAGCWASLYLGKISKIDTRLDAAFVDLGEGLTGFLQAKHVRHPGASESEARSGIGDLLKGGQLVLVQVKSEGKLQTEHENRKLPRLTMKLYVPGLFLAYSPTSSQVTISSRIQNEKILARTARLTGKGGWLVQPAAENAPENLIEFEARHLQEIWQRILAAKDARADKPGLLMAGPSAIIRALIDYDALRFEHIHAGNKRILDLIIGWCGGHLPDLAASKRLRLFRPEKTGQKLFDIHDIYAELDALRDSHVHLANGGSLIIENTSAITVIDVNQGSAPSIPEANLAAAREITRQARLRSLSGAILVDFINMDQKAERARLLEAMERAFANDTANAQVHGFTRLGIMEITRKRRSATLAEKLTKTKL